MKNIQKQVGKKGSQQRRYIFFFDHRAELREKTLSERGGGGRIVVVLTAGAALWVILTDVQLSAEAQKVHRVPWVLGRSEGNASTSLMMKLRPSFAQATTSSVDASLISFQVRLSSHWGGGEARVRRSAVHARGEKNKARRKERCTEAKTGFCGEIAACIGCDTRRRLSRRPISTQRVVMFP